MNSSGFQKFCTGVVFPSTCIKYSFLFLLFQFPKFTRNKRNKRGHKTTPTQTMHYFLRDIPQACHRFALFNPPKMGTVIWWSLTVETVETSSIPLGSNVNSEVMFLKLRWAAFKTLMTFHYTDWFIGILILAFIIIPYNWVVHHLLYRTTNQGGFEHCSGVMGT